MTDIVDIAALRALLEKATRQNLDTAEIIEYGHYDCPLCGDGEVEGCTYTNYDGVPLGVHFFGIGKPYTAAEELFRTLMPALPSLLDEIERLREARPQLQKRPTAWMRYVCGAAQFRHASADGDPPEDQGWIALYRRGSTP